MAKRNTANQDFTVNADGWDLSAGTTSRKLAITGANITITGSGSNTYTFPSTSGTLALVQDIWASSLNPGATETIAAGYSAVVVRKYTIASGTALIIGSGAIFRVL